MFDQLPPESLDALDQLEQASLNRWHERNQISLEQSRQGLSKPLDLERLLERVEGHVASHHQVD